MHLDRCRFGIPIPQENQIFKTKVRQIRFRIGPLMNCDITLGAVETKVLPRYFWSWLMVTQSLDDLPALEN